MTLLIGKRYQPELAQSLGAQGIEVIWLPDNEDVDPRLAGHADLSVFVTDGHVMVAKGVYSTIVNLLTNIEYAVIEAEREQGPEYPNDVGLCVCATGKYTIYDPKTVDPAVRPLLRGRLVPVNQGYARCAAAIVDDHSIIHHGGRRHLQSREKRRDGCAGHRAGSYRIKRIRPRVHRRRVI